VDRERELDVAGAVDVLRQEAAVLHGDERIAHGVDDQRGHLNGGEQRANVDVDISAHDLAGHLRCARVPLEAGDLGDRYFVGVRGEGGAQRGARYPYGFEVGGEGLAVLAPRTQWIVGRLGDAGEGAVEREA